MSSTNLGPLIEIITKNSSHLQELCAKNGTTIPDLNATSYDLSSEAFRADPEAAEAAKLVVTAALQLAATLAPPPVSIYHVAGGFFKSAAARVCLESNVTEILREAGPQGLHVDEIAKQNGQDPMKLSRCLRLLALHHIYREVVPDVFTNTRLSSLMDTGKPSKELFANPERKHHETGGFPALLSHNLDETFKSGAYGWEAISESSAMAFSGEPTETGLAKAFGVTGKENLWQIYEKHPFRRARFDVAMKGGRAIETALSALKAYDWSALPSGSLVVDVGGGIGSVTHTVYEKFPNLQYVVQDLPESIENGKTWWAQVAPEAIKSGKVTLQPHNFFDPQPQKGATLFMIKTILHDWSDKYCVKILKHLRAAATPNTTLLVLDSIIPYACHDPAADKGAGVRGQFPKEAPAPLLANYGAANIMGHLGDMSMWLMFNSQERTLAHFQSLLLSTGWKLTAVNRRHGDSTFLQSMEFVPV